MSLILLLPKKDQQELSARPAGTANLTEDQIAYRIEIGKRFQALLLASEYAPEKRIASIYEKCPMWGFYEDARECTGWPPRRVFGAAIGQKNNEDRVLVATLMAMYNNIPPDGMPVGSLRRVDRWSPQMLEKMKLPYFTDVKNWTDPLGFISFFY